MICSKCRAPLPAGTRECPSCRAPGEFSDADRGRMRTDIHARIMWGDSVEDIRTDWLAKGAPVEAVREELEGAFAERQRHFRSRGLRDLVLGVVGMLAGVGYTLSGLPNRVRISVYMVVLACGGVVLTIRGVHRLMTGGAAEKSASDLEEF